MIINEEIRNRIKVAAAAYAYEIENDPIMTDAEFDALCLKIKPDVVTGSKLLDTFFKTEFDPNTGSWIHKHPDLKKMSKLVLFIREFRK
jgi:hypothetical protein